MFGIGSFAVIFDEQQRVLLCHRRDYDFWGLPGGGVESGESPWQAVVREVKEEVGLDVEVERLVGVYSWPGEDDLTLTFACKAVGGELSASDESSGARYFRWNDLPPNTFQEHRKRVGDALRGECAALLRIPEGPSATEEARHVGRRREEP
jgi:8-oxo-dGTP diphosphatase